MADIVIGGRLHSAATGNTVAGANEIMDDAQGKKQSVVNQELANRISVDGQQQQAAIEAEAEARAAKDRELKALIDQGIIEGGGIVFDLEPTPDSVNPVTSNGIAGTLGYNIDNVEFVRVVVDSQNRVVFGIQRDGNVYFGAGVPEQIQTYVRDMMATIDLTDITTTLEQVTDYLAGKLGTQLTLYEELNGKVDKEEGKSLIDAEVAESFSTADNPEFLKAVTDSEGKLVAGIKKNGKVWLNDLEVDGKAFYEVVDNSEWLAVWTDANDKVLMGIRRDGNIVFGNLEENTKRYVTVDKNGSGDYTSLSECIIENKDIVDLTIYLKPGTYDLIEELKEIYGESFFDTYGNPDDQTSPSYGMYGIALGNRVKIIGCRNALITCNYTGSNSAVKMYFSPFNTYGEGFSLFGVNLEASNVRYAIHDEHRGGALVPYTVEYENCYIKLDNSANTDWSAKQCIGGGLGANANIVIKNCVFDTVGDNADAVSYHNSSNSSAKSYITCTGNYIKGSNGFRFSWFGYSQEITTILLSNNNVGRATVTRAETTPESPWGPSPYENIEVIEWNTVLH